MRWNAIKKQLLAKKIIVFIVGISVALLSYGTYRIITHRYAATQSLTQPPQEVVGKIITLKLLREDYYLQLHDAFSDTVRKNLEFPAHITLAYTIRHEQYKQRLMQDGKVVIYCIFDNKSNKLIGETEIRDKNDHDPGQFSIWVNENYWGGGRTQEAIKLITDVYFRLKPNEKSFIAHVRLWNKRSYHALKKAGFVDVGYFYEDGKPARSILEMKR